MSARSLTAADLEPGALVALDVLVTVPAAYLSAQTWNGWACPYLDRAATDAVVAALVGDQYHALRWATDGVTLEEGVEPGVYGPGDPVDTGEPLTWAPLDGGDAVLIDGVPHWTPGAWAWCWSIVTPDDDAATLDAIRASIEAESVSWSELATLQGMADRIPADDLTLREWAGLPEHDGSEQ